MFSPELNIILAFLGSFLITLLTIPKVIFLAKKLRLFDAPGARAAHKESVPISGGIAIFLGVIFSLLFFGEVANIQFILISVFIVFFVGLIDDLLGLSPTKKIIGQILAIVILIYLQELKIDNMYGVLGVYNLSDFIATIFTIFVVVVITNGYNLVDGVDGLAGGVGIISSIAFGIVAIIMKQFNIAIIAFTLTGSLIAFLKYNFHPARIFMGDTGSLVVGMILSVLAINLIQHGFVTENIFLSNKGPLLAIGFLSLPLFDSLRVFISRVIQRRDPLSPGRDHIHHALLDLGFGHKNTARILYMFSLIAIVVVYVLIEENLNISITILSVLAYILLLFPIYLSKKNNR